MFKEVWAGMKETGLLLKAIYEALPRVYTVLVGLLILSVLFAIPTMFAESWLVIDLSLLARSALLPIAALLLIPDYYWRTRLLIVFYLAFFSTNFAMAIADEVFIDLLDDTINKFRIILYVTGSLILSVVYFVRGTFDARGKNREQS